MAPNRTLARQRLTKSTSRQEFRSNLEIPESLDDFRYELNPSSQSGQRSSASSSFYSRVATKFTLPRGWSLQQINLIRGRFGDEPQRVDGEGESCSFPLPEEVAQLLTCRQPRICALSSGLVVPHILKDPFSGQGHGRLLSPSCWTFGPPIHCLPTCVVQRASGSVATGTRASRVGERMASPAKALPGRITSDPPTSEIELNRSISLAGG